MENKSIAFLMVLAIWTNEMSVSDKWAMTFFVAVLVKVFEYWDLKQIELKGNKNGNSKKETE